VSIRKTFLKLTNLTFMVDFFHQKLQGSSFKDQNLSKVDFRDTNIGGTDFSNAYLVGANLSRTKTGLKLVWKFCLIIGLVLLTLVTGFIAAYSGAGIGTVLYRGWVESFFTFAITCLFTLGLLVCFIVITIRQGLGSAISALAIVIVIAMTLLASLPGSLKTIARYIVFMGIIVGANIASVVTGAIANAFTQTLLNKWVLSIVQLLILLGAIAGSMAGIVGETKSEAILAGNFSTVIITVIMISLSWYAGNESVKGNSKYALIHQIAVAASNLGSTSFRGANLTDADFTGANLKYADFRGANLARTCWFGTKHLAQARISNTYLADPKILQLVVTLNGQNQNFDHMDMRGLNLQGANLTDASLIGTKLSETNLQGANLTRAKLMQAQLYGADLSGTCLTGAVIQDWSISSDTNFEAVKCDYVYMQLPTKTDPDPYRKPDNRNEIFQEGDFADFIAPIIKTLNLYQTQNVDLRIVAKQFKTLDLFHHEGIDPTAAVIALKQLIEQHPEAELEVIALEGRGNEKIRLQAKVTGNTNRSALNAEYFAKYQQVKSLPYSDMQSLLTGIEEKDERIRGLEKLLENAISQPKFYVETYQNQGEFIMTQQNKGNVNISGVQGNISGIAAAGENQTMTGVAIGAISGSVTNTINQLPASSDPENDGIKELLAQLLAAIESAPELPNEDKAEALEQVKVLAEAGQKPEDNILQKAAKTAMKIIKGTVASLPDATKLVEECGKLLPTIAKLLALL
jgi:uncharacterized protein YjbI with pentapeptide repeats